MGQITPPLASVATSGSFLDLSDVQTIPSGAPSMWPAFAGVAMSGSYLDLSNKPSIPAAQVNADWNAGSGLASILNKPTIPPAISLTTTGTSGRPVTQTDSEHPAILGGYTGVSSDGANGLNVIGSVAADSIVTSGGGPTQFSALNDNTTGTAAGYGAEQSATGMIAATTDLTRPAYVCVSGCGADGSGLFAVSPGAVPVQQDATSTWTVGYPVAKSGTTAGGYYHGAASFPAGTWIYGTVRYDGLVQINPYVVGAQGPQGNQGAQGAQGPPGAGATEYVLSFDGVTADPGDGSTLTWSTTGTPSASAGSQYTTTWTVPTGLHWARIISLAAGASGGFAIRGTNSGGGGSSGGGADVVCPLTPGATISIAVGIGGVPTTIPIAGGDSSFGSCVTVWGGRTCANSGACTGTSAVGVSAGYPGWISGTRGLIVNAAGTMVAIAGPATAASYCMGSAANGSSSVRADVGGCGGYGRSVAGAGYTGGQGMMSGSAGAPAVSTVPQGEPVARRWVISRYSQVLPTLGRGVQAEGGPLVGVWCLARQVISPAAVAAGHLAGRRIREPTGQDAMVLMGGSMSLGCANRLLLILAASVALAQTPAHTPHYPNTSNGAVLYGAELSYAPSSLWSTINNWLGNHFDWILGGGGTGDPHGTNPANLGHAYYASYVDMPRVPLLSGYQFQTAAMSHGFVIENIFLHANVDSALTAYSGTNRFDAFDPTNSLGTYLGGVFVYNGSTYADVTRASWVGGTTTIANTLYAGYLEPFDQMNFVISTARVGRDGGLSVLQRGHGWSLHQLGYDHVAIGQYVWPDRHGAGILLPAGRLGAEYADREPRSARDNHQPEVLGAGRSCRSDSFTSLFQPERR